MAEDPKLEKARAILDKLAKKSTWTDEELQELQQHVDVLERRGSSSHHDTTSHHHTVRMLTAGEM
jgi:hypothetical protein